MDPLITARNSSTRLTARTILAFWYPLAATWLMMAVEGPYVAAIIARLPNPTVNLAAYGVAFSFAFLTEAPITMVLTAANALARDRQSFLALRRFMTLLNVVFFSVSGGIGLKVLLTMLSRLEEAQTPRVIPGPSPSPVDSAGPPSQPESASTATSSPPEDRTAARATFRVWVVIYALVGAQMGWILRPFIGSPNLPFEWFRHREANVFIAVVRTIGTLLGL